MLKYFYKEKDERNMKRKVLILIIIVLLLTGCKNARTPKKEMPKKNIEEEVVVEEQDIYIDENKTPISFYKLSGNTLQKINIAYEMSVLW